MIIPAVADVAAAAADQFQEIQLPSCKTTIEYQSWEVSHLNL
jgi:hypothetical protein